MLLKGSAGVKLDLGSVVDMVFFGLGELAMVTTFKGIVSNGSIKPLDNTKLPDGEVTVTISTVAKSSPDWLDRIAGKWANQLDCDQLERDIYESRLIQTRPVPKL